jgi:hypothetical protein
VGGKIPPLLSFLLVVFFEKFGEKLNQSFQAIAAHYKIFVLDFLFAYKTQHDFSPLCQNFC